MISQNCKNINVSILTELSGTPKSFFSEETNRRIEKITTGKHTQQKERKRRRGKKKGNRSCHQWSTPDSLLGREKQEGTSIDEA